MKKLKFTLNISDVDRSLFDLKELFVWGSWNCNRSNIARKIPVEFTSSSSTSTIEFTIPFPNRKFHSIDAVYINSVILLEHVPIPHGVARFDMKNFKEKNMFEKGFVDFLAPKNEFYEYGKVQLNLRTKKEKLIFDNDASIISYDEMKKFCLALIQQRRKYWKQFQDVSSEVDRVIWDTYMSKMGILMIPDIYPTIKQLPMTVETLRTLANYAMRVYGISEETFISCCNSIGIRETLTCEELLTYNAISLMICFHGLGMKYHRDVDINPRTGSLVGNESLQEGDSTGYDDCDGSNRTPSEIINSIMESSDITTDNVLLSLKHLLKHYCPLMISASAEKEFLDAKHAAYPTKKEKNDFNGHITAILVPAKNIFKQHPSNLPQHKDLKSILDVISKFERRPYLQTFFVECTGPEEPIFATKITLLGQQRGTQCLAEIKSLAKVMVDNPLFEKLTVPVLQFNYNLDDSELPNNFLRMISVGIWSRFVEPINDIKNVEMRPFVKRKEKDEIVYLHGCTMKDLIQNEVYWVPSPPLDEEALKNFADWIPHIPRVSPFTLTPCPKKIPSLKRKGAFSTCDSYLIPIMIKCEDFNNAELAEIDSYMFQKQNVEAYQWNLVEMGDESLLFLTFKMENKEKELDNIQQKIQTLMYDDKNRVLLVSGKHSVVKNRDIFTIHIRKATETYAIAFFMNDPEELKEMTKFFANFIDAFSASIIFKEGLSISVSSKKFGNFSIHVDDISDIHILKYEKEINPTLFGSHLMNRIFKEKSSHLSTEHILPEIDNDSQVHQFSTMNDSHAYRLKLKNKVDEVAPSLKNVAKHIDTLSISKLRNITEVHASKLLLPNYGKNYNELDRFLQFIQNQEQYIHYFSTTEELLSFLPDNFSVSIISSNYDSIVNVIYFYFNFKENMIKFGICEKLGFTKEELEMLKKVKKISKGNNTLELDGVPFLKFKVSYQVLINSINVDQLLKGDFTSFQTQWDCDDFNHHNTKDSLKFMHAANPAIIAEYFLSKNVYSFKLILNKSDYAFFGNFDGSVFQYLSFSSLNIDFGDEKEYEIMIHDNVLYLGKVGSNESSSMNIPSDVYFVESNFELDENDLYQLVRNNFVEEHSVELQKEQVLVHFVPISNIYMYSYSSNYFFLYSPILRMIYILFYHYPSSQFMIHAVNLYLDKNFIVNRDLQNNVVFDVELLMKVMDDHSTMLNISSFYSSQIFKDDFTEEQISYLTHYILHFVSERLKLEKPNRPEPLDFDINFFKVFFKVSNVYFGNAATLQSWWNDDHISLREKILYLLFMILNAPLSSFSFLPFSAEPLPIELRNVF